MPLRDERWGRKEIEMRIVGVGENTEAIPRDASVESGKQCLPLLFHSYLLLLLFL